VANVNPINTNDVADGSINTVAFAVAANLPNAWQVTASGSSAAPPSGVAPVPSIRNPLTPYIAWPGATSIVSLNYTLSHGISPATATLTINPQNGTPDTEGFLIFGDGIRPPITMRDCHLDQIVANVSGAGLRYDLHISDRRWRWQQGYMIRGEYNRLDNNGNLVPWTVQSATELAVLCLNQMGETNYKIAFPPGLTHAQAVNTYSNYLQAGERYPLTLANPYVCWDHIPAAVALQRLADMFGCRVIYDPITDGVFVYPVGYGNTLPYGGTSVASASQGVESARVPQYVGVTGAPIKFQMRVALEHVGIEWNDYIARADLLTYAPILKAAIPAQNIAAVYGWDNAGTSFWTVQATPRLAYPEAIQKAQDCIFRKYRIREYQDITPFGRRSPGGIDVSGNQQAFNAIRVPGLNDPIVIGPLFDANVIATGDNTKLYGTISRRQQIILTPTKVAQTIPQPRRDVGIAGSLLAGVGQGTLPDYYNGYSRDRPAECFGTYTLECSQGAFQLTADAANGATVTKKRIYLPFTVNPIEQTVNFGAHLYLIKKNGVNGSFPASDLFIETGVNILEEDTNALIRCKYTMWLGGDAPPIWETHDDIITHIVGEYDGGGGVGGGGQFSTSAGTDPTGDSALDYNPVGPCNITGYHVNDFGDGAARAAYYLQAMARRFQNWQSQTVEYNGCMLIPPSGSVQQIHWSFDSGGIRTKASVNTEFSQHVPPYAYRKNTENMPPNEEAKVNNLAASPVAAIKAALKWHR
jgi:hypothetical protein